MPRGRSVLAVERVLQRAIAGVERVQFLLKAGAVDRALVLGAAGRLAERGQVLGDRGRVGVELVRRAEGAAGMDVPCSVFAKSVK